MIYTWGSTAAERADAYPCDALLERADVTVFRAVDVEASADFAFRWICQLRVAPYSYDLIDNLGRRSPQQLTPDVDRLAIGQRFMTIFRLSGFEPGRSITLLHRGRLFGRVAVTYRVAPAGAGRSRLVAKLLARSEHRRLARAFGPLLATGDLVMMRRQLLNLKALAERE
ncbi:MAG: hypothetical protein ACR2HD_01545 [Solirubrobacteraceae bacterium]